MLSLFIIVIKWVELTITIIIFSGKQTWFIFFFTESLFDDDDPPFIMNLLCARRLCITPDFILSATSECVLYPCFAYGETEPQQD